MRFRAGLFASLALLLPVAVSSDASASVLSEPATDKLIIIVGAGGADEFGVMFREWCERWQAAGSGGELSVTTIGEGDAAESDRDAVLHALGSLGGEHPRLWLVLIGHGTFDGRIARFNLRGPDLSAADLATALDGVSSEVAVINCSSASAPFLEALSGPDRIVITATRTGQEVNFSRFGGYLSECIADLSADLDKDDQVSLLEAFLTASRRTEEFYRGETRLVTEHALIDDDGDGVGARAAAFVGIRPVSETESGSVDGLRAHQWHLVPNAAERELTPDLRARRDELELEVITLRGRKEQMAEDAYFAELELLLIQLAELYESAAASEAAE